MATNIVPYTAPYLDLITWEHQKPKLLATLEGLLEGYVGVRQAIALLPQAFDIDTAVGAQLDIVGQWVGHSRVITTELPNLFFCWDGTIITEDGDPEPSGPTGWDEGTWWSPFLPSSSYVVLDDNHYRILLKAKVVANYWDGTIPDAYEAWNTIFEPEGYHIVIQNGMADAVEEFYWDDLDFARHGWDFAGWAVYLLRHTNFIRNSACLGTVILADYFPTYWSHYGQWLPTILEIQPIDGIDTVHFGFQGTMTTEESYVWFEEPGIITMHFSETRNRTFSVYFREHFHVAAIDHLYVEIVAYDDEDIIQSIVSNEIFPIYPVLTQRVQVTYLYDGGRTDIKYVRPRIRFTHAVGSVINRYDLTLGGPQIEMGNVATSWIRTTGTGSVEYIRPPVVAKVNGGMHMIYGLIAPYQDPPPLPAYFNWDSGFKRVFWDPDSSASSVFIEGTEARALQDNLYQTTTASPGSSDRFYFEILAGGSGDRGFGVANASVLNRPRTIPDWQMGLAGSIGWYPDGRVLLDGVVVANWEPYTPEARLCFAVDGVNRRLWGRVVLFFAWDGPDVDGDNPTGWESGTWYSTTSAPRYGSWNNDPTADPTDGIGGVDISSLPDDLFIGASLHESSDYVIGYFAESDWNFVAPSDFFGLQQDVVGFDEKGWEAGIWDLTQFAAVAPTLDAVTMALFTGGHLDLRPAGVFVEYCIQSLVGTPFFAWDTGAQAELATNFLTWDDTDLFGWDIAVWDATIPTFVTEPVRAPPTSVSGWELGAWPNFVDAFAEAA